MRPSARLVVFISAFAAAGAAHAQQPASSTNASPKRPVLFSASGGISRGAYQGGVDWTLSEFLRRQRSEAFRERLGVSAEFELGSATGASAGNINALFAAMAWCTVEARPTSDRPYATEIAAEDSLFWKTWVNTGTHELLPPDSPSKERAALDREFFETVHRQSVEDFRANAIGHDGCALPVGLTLTKLTPIEVSLDGDPASKATATVQRFASIFRVTTDAQRLTFSPPLDEQAEAGRLGALALLPALRHSPLDDWKARLDAVFNVVLASSSFPVAFAPREVKYELGGLRMPGTPLSVETAQFSDGGVFDNNPLGLSWGLFELEREARAQKLDPRARVMVAYSSPGTYRGALDKARRPGPNGQERTGLGAAVQLIGGAIASARQYELQAFARQMDRDEKLKISTPELRLSTRAFPIVGETLFSFGAFLGRPFRERDFYLGVYDGLEFVARHFLCAERPAERREACVVAQHIQLISTNAFAMSRLARASLTHYVREEYGVTIDPDPDGATPPARDLLHAELLRKVDAYLPKASLPPSALNCPRGGDLVVRHLCPGGLDAMLDQMYRDAALKEAAKTFLDECNADPKLRATGGCIVDQGFYDLLSRPRHEAYRLGKKVLENIERAEDSIGDQRPRTNVPEYSAWVETAFSLYRSGTYRYRDGVVGPFEFVMSSARGFDNYSTKTRIASVLGWISPGYFQWTRSGDQDDNLALGWRPLMWVFNSKAFLSTNAELSLRELSVARIKSSEPYGLGLSLGTFGIPGITVLEAGAFWMPQPLANAVVPSERWTEGQANRWIGRLSTRLLADKVQVTVLAKPHAFSFGLGASDLNGLVFWWVR